MIEWFITGVIVIVGDLLVIHLLWRGLGRMRKR